MKKSTTDRQRFICGLCVFLALVCAFCLLFPHIHECEGIQCQVCMLFSVCKMLWIPPAIGSTLWIAAFLLIGYQRKEDTGTEFSLVRLKVKLSD